MQSIPRINKSIVIILLTLSSIVSINAQSPKDSIVLNNPEQTVLHLGDKLFLKDDPEEYVVTYIGKSIGLGKSSSMRLTTWELNVQRTSKKLKTEELEQNFLSSQRKNYLERRQNFDPYTIRNYQTKNGTKSGIISYVALYHDSIRITHIDYDGIFRSEVVSPKQILKEKLEYPNTLQDTTMYLAAAMHWYCDQQLFGIDTPKLGQFLPSEESTIKLTVKDPLESNDINRNRLISNYRQRNHLWQYKNGKLKLWSTGGASKGNNEQKIIDQAFSQITFIPKEITPNSIELLVVSKEQKVFRQKPFLRSSQIKYIVDSVKINHPNYSHVAFGDLITIKEDTAEYYVEKLVGWDMKIRNIETGQIKTFRQSTEKDLHKEIDQILSKNYNDFSTIKKTFPIHSKVKTKANEDVYIRELDFKKQICHASRWDKFDELSWETIPFNELQIQNQKFDSFTDTMEFIYATQFWRFDKYIFNIHSPETGKISLQFGERITFTHPLHSERNKKNKLSQEIDLDYFSNKYWINSTDFFIHSKGAADFDGIWFLEKDVLHLHLIGSSYSFKNDEISRSNSRNRTKNYWMHKIQFKIVQLSSTAVTFELINHESELANPILTAKFSHIQEY